MLKHSVATGRDRRKGLLTALHSRALKEPPAPGRHPSQRHLLPVGAAAGESQIKDSTEDKKDAIIWGNKVIIM